PLTLLLIDFTQPPPTNIYTLSLHDALPICNFRKIDLILCLAEKRRKVERLTHQVPGPQLVLVSAHVPRPRPPEKLRHRGEHAQRSEEHTSELQSPDHLVCRLLLEKKNKNKK